jgi:hypothetical protein
MESEKCGESMSTPQNTKDIKDIKQWKIRAGNFNL